MSATETFVEFSAAITGFTTVDVYGTGLVDPYWETVTSIVGEQTVDDLLGAWARVRDEAAGDDAKLADGLRRDVFSDPKLGPIARNLIKLWYGGIWYELPPDWSEAYGVPENDSTFTVSPSAYTEGLMWPAIGANPPGAKGPGFASWTGPPKIEGITT